MSRRQILFALVVVSSTTIWQGSSLRAAYPQVSTSPGRRRLRGYHHQSITKRKKRRAVTLQQVESSSLLIGQGTDVRRFVQMDNDTASIQPPMNALERDLTTSCHEGDSFTLLTPQQHLIQGCYRVQDELMGQYLYASDDHVDSGELVIAAAQIGGEDSDNVRWILFSIDPRAHPAYKAYCYSINYARDVHPAQATWMCDLTGENQFDHGVENLEASCGCLVSPPASTPLKSRVGWHVAWFLDNWTRVVVLAALFSVCTGQLSLEGSGQAVLRPRLL